VHTENNCTLTKRTHFMRWRCCLVRQWAVSLSGV
jgi:hypothetical protein